MALSVVLAGGGTGGHIVPALALAETIRKHEPGARVLFVGSARGLETSLVPAAGFDLELVASRQVLGRGPLASAAALLAVARGTLQARRLLGRPRADLVIGVGGYASVPAVLAARTLGIPSALLEPNARPGRANRLLGRFARAVFVQFEDAIPWFPAGRAILSGYPVREMPEPNGAAPGARLEVVLTGGSQGARSLNRAFAAVLGRLPTERLHITHQTGAAHADEVRAAYATADVHAEIAPFFDDLHARIARADLLVARAGASTCAELCASGCAAILVPYPHAADDHQTANARELERAGAALWLPDTELDARLGDELLALIVDDERRRRMGEAAARRARPDAAQHVWQTCAAWLEREDAA